MEVGVLVPTLSVVGDLSPGSNPSGVGAAEVSSGMGVAFPDCGCAGRVSGAGAAMSALSLAGPCSSFDSFFGFLSFLTGVPLSTLPGEEPDGVEVPLVLFEGWPGKLSFGVIGDKAARGDTTSFSTGEIGFSDGTGVDPFVGGFVVVVGREDSIELGVCTTFPDVAVRRYA